MEFGETDIDEMEGAGRGQSLGLRTAAATGCWYESDLQLAAELGKNLLERNRDLESQVKTAQQSHWEAVKEIDLLSRQLEVLRSVGDSRALLYEEVDRNLQDLERANDRLKQQAQKDKEKIALLTSTNESLEAEIDELQLSVNELKKREGELNKKEHRAWSVPSLTEMNEHEYTRSFINNFDYLGFPSVFNEPPPKKENAEIKDMKNQIRNLRLQMTIEKRKREEAECDLEYMSQEHGVLKSRLDELSNQREKEREAEITQTLRTSFLCRECGGQQASLLPDRGLIEHDLKEIPPRGEVVRLKNGGSAFGSRESLNMLGLQADDDTPSKEIMKDILMADAVSSNASVDGDASPRQALGERELAGSPSGGTMSLLSELEEQYTKLVHKYEALIEAKTKKTPSGKDISTQDNLCNEASDSIRASQRPTKLPLKTEEQDKEGWQGTALDFKSPYNPVDDHFDKGPPEYKMLFKEIFDTLRRSIAQDAKSSKSTPCTERRN